MKIYIDSNYKCHVSNQCNSYRSFNVQFFDLKCTEFIEGYRYIPIDETWTDQNGEVHTGEMVFPWKPLDELDINQYKYEQKLVSEYGTVFTEIERLIKSEPVSGSMDTIVEARKRAILKRISELA